MKNIVLFGAGGLAKETVNMINHGINPYTEEKYCVRGFVVEEEYYKPNTIISGLPVLGTEEWLYAHSNEVCCAITIGDYTHERERIFRELERNNVKIESLICGNAFVPETCKIGKGCYIGTRTLLSADVEIGEGTFINSDVMVGHDVRIGDFCSIYPRATISGGCILGNHVDIGGASYIVPRKRIGSEAVVAAGSVVFTNVRSKTHVIGNPAKRIRALE